MGKIRNVNVRSQKQWDIVLDFYGKEQKFYSFISYGINSVIEIGTGYVGELSDCEDEEVISFEQWQKEIEGSKAQSVTFEELQTKVDLGMIKALVNQIYIELSKLD